MAKFLFHVGIIFWMIAGCIGPRGISIEWTGSLSERLMDIFYGTYPDDERHMKRVKQIWDVQVPRYNRATIDQLEVQVRTLQKLYLDRWKERPAAEREEVENALVHIYNATEKYQRDREMHMLNMFLSYNQKYVEEARLIRTVVYRWYDLYAPLGKEIFARDVDWMPHREAYLQHIAEQVVRGKGSKASKIKQQWSEKYKHLNVNERSLVRHLDSIKNRDKRASEGQEADAIQEGGPVSRGKRVKWDPQMKTDILYIHDMIKNLDVNFAAAMKNRWDKMQRNTTHLSGKVLLAWVYHLKSLGYEPKSENILEAGRKYAKLSPLPKEVFLKRRATGKRHTRPLQILETHQPNQQHQEEPSLSSVFQHILGKINTTYAGHDHHSHQIDYHGSSSYIPIDQSLIASLPDTQQSHQQFWHPVGSSSYTPIHHDSIGSLPEIPYPHQDFWGLGGSSSHTPVQPHPFDSLSDFQYPYEHFLSGISSSHASIDQGPSESQRDTPRPHPDFWSSGGSSNHTAIHQNPSGSLPGIPDPHEHSSSPGDSSSYALVHEDPSGLIAVALRPRHLQRDHRGRSNRTSVHQDSSHTHVETPHPYDHQWFPGSGSRH